jgi:hypothetical protein
MYVINSVMLPLDHISSAIPNKLNNLQITLRCIQDLDTLIQIP